MYILSPTETILASSSLGRIGVPVLESSHAQEDNLDWKSGLLLVASTTTFETPYKDQGYSVRDDNMPTST